MSVKKINGTIKNLIEKILLGKSAEDDGKKLSKNKWIEMTCNFLLGVLLICFFIYVFVSVQQFNQLKEKNLKLDKEVVQLETNNNKLKQQKKSLETNEEIERVARKELGLVKPGEVPYVK